ncbi:MAG TPA: tRNA epoxyqueuosine(34) reductase QueG [bacterium]|nr:tRNA epoxyqueuosine(34) reductase QueG [bacterium]
MTAVSDWKLKNYLKDGLREMGFCGVGFASPGMVDEETRSHCLEWLHLGYHGSMGWLRQSMPVRLDVRKFYPEVKTVVSLAFPWGRPEGKGEFLSGYAWLTDYHRVLEQKLKDFRSLLKRKFPEIRLRTTVDTSPVLEKYWAVQAGLGWMGKNTLLVTPEYGSWVFLATLLINVPLTPDLKKEDRCGRCRLCLEACPTGALRKAYLLNATRCLAYLTVEHNQPLTAEEKTLLQGAVFGCDRCQVVCPFNQPSEKETCHLKQRQPANTALLKELATINHEEFQRRFGQTPVIRIGWEKFRAQVLAALNYYQEQGMR